MYYYQYPAGSFFYRVDPEISHVRILHASPDAPPVDIYANGNIVARGLAYKGFTEYMPFQQGEYAITVFRAGQTSNPIISTRATLPAGQILTVTVVNPLARIELFTVPDPSIQLDPGKAFLRFVHLSPDTPNVDITFPDGTRIFRDVGYRGITNYVPLDQGTYTLEARPTQTENIALYVPNINLTPGRAYTAYAVGLSRGNPPLQVLIALDGSSYITV